MARELDGDRGERFGIPTLEGIAAIARKLNCAPKSVLRRARDKIDPLWVLVDPFGKKYAFVAAVESWVHRRTLSLQTVEQIERLAVKTKSAAPSPKRSPAPVKEAGSARQRSRLQ